LVGGQDSVGHARSMSREGALRVRRERWSASARGELADHG
jgi:hypothetical protein